jgi:heptosyltransferase-2
LGAANYEIIILAGKEEENIADSLSKITVAKFIKTKDKLDLISVINLCDLIVTGITLAMHVTIGLEKKIVVLNNIFPTNEFYLYGLGKILEPDITCRYCYKTRQDSSCEHKNCLDLIKAEEVFDNIKNLLDQ